VTDPLYLVFGGELSDVTKTDFIDPTALHLVGLFPVYQDAEDAWRANIQRTVDNAQMRYFIVPISDPIGINCKPA
jgi:hypothetical protein